MAGHEKLVRTDPYTDGTDGFFVAVFQRKGAQDVSGSGTKAAGKAKTKAQSKGKGTGAAQSPANGGTKVGAAAGKKQEGVKHAAGSGPVGMATKRGSRETHVNASANASGGAPGKKQKKSK